jgi:hypothetical protein
MNGVVYLGYFGNPSRGPKVTNILAAPVTLLKISQELCKSNRWLPSGQRIDFTEVVLFDFSWNVNSIGIDELSAPSNNLLAPDFPIGRKFLQYDRWDAMIGVNNAAKDCVSAFDSGGNCSHIG